MLLTGTLQCYCTVLHDSPCVWFVFFDCFEAAGDALKLKVLFDVNLSMCVAYRFDLLTCVLRVEILAILGRD